jgi:hypothetical protein
MRIEGADIQLPSQGVPKSQGEKGDDIGDECLRGLDKRRFKVPT